MPVNKFIFAAYADSADGREQIVRLARSLRHFGGRFSQSPLWAFSPDDLDDDISIVSAESDSLNIDWRRSHTPPAAKWFYYAGKVYAAAQAEKSAEKTGAILIWMDNDTIILSEPQEFDLEPGVGLAYKPVMHNRSGSKYGHPPDPFWSRIYHRLSLDDQQLFPMTTPADNERIRAYFQAGILAVRPESGILRKWSEDFKLLYEDPVLVEMCKNDNTKRVFLHQTALVGSILHSLDRAAMRELSDRYNYPLLFEKHYGAVKPFNSIDEVATLRVVISSEKMGDQWPDEIEGPPDKIAWLKKNL